MVRRESAEEVPVAATTQASGRALHRKVGVMGLTFFALGSVIGSGWLFGARNAAAVAGPASIISWPLAGIMLLVIVLAYAELAPAYPVAGGMYRLAHYSYGGLGGFVMGWVSWLFSISLIPIEVEAAIFYLSGLKGLSWMVDANGNLAMPKGFLIAAGLALVFALINLYGVQLFAHSNSAVVWWKVAVPVVTIIALVGSMKAGNWHAAGGFLPSFPKGTTGGGVQGIFLALPLAVVFAEIGFDSAIQMAGEARNPRRDLIRAVLWSTVIGVVLYTLLQMVFIGAMPAKYLGSGWAGMTTTFSKTVHGPYVKLASVAGLTWLVYALYVDAVVSPSGTGFTYTGTHSRLLYGMSKGGYLPKPFSRLNLKGVPWFSLIIGWAVAVLLMLPFPSWNSLVGAITSVAVISYAVGPLAVAHFRRADPDRDRPFRLPRAELLGPLGFVFATLMVYWTGWQVMWRVDIGIVVGLILMGIHYAVTPAARRPGLDAKHSVWIWPWLVGLNLFAVFGAFEGTVDTKPIQLDSWYHAVGGALKFPYDTIWVVLFGLVIYVLARKTALPADKVQRYAAADREEVAAGEAAQAPTTAS
jgi:amino acid transporter